MRRVLMGLIVMAMVLVSFAYAEVPASDVWMYAASVGKADAILVGVDDRVCLIDTGYIHSRGRILAAMERMGAERLDAVFITHTDSDHVDGLEWLAESGIEVGTWYASAMFTDVKESKHPAVKAAKVRGQEVVWLRSGDSVEFGSAVFEVLAPGVLNPSEENDNSLVMMLRTTEGSILLSGDMEYPEEQWLLASGIVPDCDVLKVANHGDDDTGSEAFLRAASPKLAVISTDSMEKPGTPDPLLMLRLELTGASVWQTQNASGGVLVRLKGGEAHAEYVNLPEPSGELRLTAVVAGEDRIVLTNAGSQSVPLKDWYLVSDKGDEWYVFPENAVIGPGQSLTVGTNTTEGQYDLLWEEKKVVHKSKTDVVTLYSPDGWAVSSMSNGF